MTRRAWYATDAPDYGRMRDRLRVIPPPAGTVVVRSTKPGASRPSSRRVSLRPAFDPLAISMTPIPGWRAPVADLAAAA